MQTLPFSEARSQLAQALRSVEAGHEPFSITRRGHVAGVLMSFDQYQHLSDQSGFADKLQAWRVQHLPADPAATDDDPFANLRQRDAAREFSW